LVVEAESAKSDYDYILHVSTSPVPKVRIIYWGIRWVVCTTHKLPGYYRIVILRGARSGFVPLKHAVKRVLGTVVRETRAWGPLRQSGDGRWSTEIRAGRLLALTPARYGTRAWGVSGGGVVAVLLLLLLAVVVGCCRSLLTIALLIVEGGCVRYSNRSKIWWRYLAIDAIDAQFTSIPLVVKQATILKPPTLMWGFFPHKFEATYTYVRFFPHKFEQPYVEIKYLT